jgi:hypothetical protein
MFYLESYCYKSYNEITIYLNRNHRHLKEQKRFQEHQMRVPKKVVIVVVYPCDEDHSPIWLELHLVPIQHTIRNAIIFAISVLCGFYNVLGAP